MKKLFTDRYGLTQPRVKERLDADASLGLLALLEAKIDGHWFGESFPSECEDGYRCDIGSDRSWFVDENILYRLSKT